MNSNSNMNPHKPAIVAILIYGELFPPRIDEAMDLWDTLSEEPQAYCRAAVKSISQARREICHMSSYEDHPHLRNASPEAIVFFARESALDMLREGKSTPESLRGIIEDFVRDELYEMAQGINEALELWEKE